MLKETKSLPSPNPDPAWQLLPSLWRNPRQLPRGSHRGRADPAQCQQTSGSGRCPNPAHLQTQHREIWAGSKRTHQKTNQPVSFLTLVRYGAAGALGPSASWPLYLVRINQGPFAGSNCGKMKNSHRDLVLAMIWYPQERTKHHKNFPHLLHPRSWANSMGFILFLRDLPATVLLCRGS